MKGWYREMMASHIRKQYNNDGMVFPLDYFLKIILIDLW